jgi:hypothetical protein
MKSKEKKKKRKKKKNKTARVGGYVIFLNYYVDYHHYFVWCNNKSSYKLVLIGKDSRFEMIFRFFFYVVAFNA